MSAGTERLNVIERHLRSALDALDKAKTVAHFGGPKAEQIPHEAVVGYHAREAADMAHRES